MTKKIFKAVSLLLVFVFVSFSAVSLGIPKAEAAPARPVASSLRHLKVYPGGMPFGVKFLTEGILIVNLAEVCTQNKICNPAKEAGLHVNDVLLKVNGIPLESADEFSEIIQKNGHTPLKIQYRRNGSNAETVLTPVFSEKEGRYASGLYVRDSGAGIGTVTFILPKTGAFGGLGHGICDSQTGELIPIQRGSVTDVTIHGIVKGLPGSPGEVKGYFTPQKTGTLLGNTHCGVYGVLSEIPKTVPSEPISLGLRDEVKEGKAYLYTMLDSQSPQRYEIKIKEIQRNAQGNKCFTVTVTDPTLLEKTGGIIQGMSGSPILQNGKLIGAVTHVCVNL